jgi:cytochrome c oxidase assembly factor CtaG
VGGYRSPLAALGHELLTAHMAQHLLLMTVAAPLILLGAPAITLLNGLPRPFVNRVLKPLVRWPVVHKLERIVAHPLFCWLGSTAAVIGWHIPSLFQLGVRTEKWHEVEQGCFFNAGLLFPLPVVQPWPSVARWPRWSVPLYLFLATLLCDGLSAFLAFRFSSSLINVAARRSGMCRCADVGLCDVCLPRPSSSDHNSDTLVAGASLEDSYGVNVNMATNGRITAPER